MSKSNEKTAYSLQSLDGNNETMLSDDEPVLNFV